MYYIHYNKANRAMFKTLRNVDILGLHRHVKNMLCDGCNNISVFNFDTWNTSEPEGLVLFDKSNYYWNAYNEEKPLKAKVLIV